jgi:hypothetical protein
LGSRSVGVWNGKTMTFGVPKAGGSVGVGLALADATGEAERDGAGEATPTSPRVAHTKNRPQSRRTALLRQAQSDN